MPRMTIPSATLIARPPVAITVLAMIDCAKWLDEDGSNNSPAVWFFAQAFGVDILPGGEGGVNGAPGGSTHGGQDNSPAGAAGFARCLLRQVQERPLFAGEVPVHINGNAHGLSDLPLHARTHNMLQCLEVGAVSANQEAASR